MNIIHDLYDIYALDCLIRAAYSIYQAVGRSNRTLEKMAVLKNYKEITMHANGHTTVWGTQIGVGRARVTKSWYQQIRDRWTAYQAARHDAKLATLRARWDARHEAVRPRHADAAIDMVASTHVFSTTTALCDLAV
jgi:hypothetical protein